MYRSFAACVLSLLVLALVSGTVLADFHAQRVEIGELVSARGTDEYGCPLEETTRFKRANRLYFIAVNSNLPRGTDLFVRISFNGLPLEDSVLLTADQDYRNVCVFFEFVATNSLRHFAVGDYNAQLIVNGRAGPSVYFQVAKAYMP